MEKLRLPWPPSLLSPNARGSWRKKEGARKKYKSDCGHLAKAAIPSFCNNEIHLKIVFYPPDNRRRDLDNMLASIKYGLDAIAQSWGVDDNRFAMTIRRGCVIKHGLVTVEVLNAA
jgi:crossover junction endodeoxyribonuclease RusA